MQLHPARQTRVGQRLFHGTCMPKTFTPVVGNPGQQRALAQQTGKIIELRFADRTVQATLTLAAGVHIPDAQALRQRDSVDVVALQEVDGPEAARQVFRQGWQLDCFTRRAHPQKVGFAIREGVPFRCNGDLAALDIDGGTRAGADVTLWPGTPREVRLLAVHLKSGCFTGKLDRSFEPCSRLRQQVPVVEAWIDQRVREGTAFAILGDFNRHLDKDARYPAGPDEAAPFNVVQAWSDDAPRGAVLMRATEGQRYQGCDANDKHRQYIDDIFIDQKLAAQNGDRRFARLSFDAADQGRQLSDHCPVIWALKP